MSSLFIVLERDSNECLSLKIKITSGPLVLSWLHEAPHLIDWNRFLNANEDLQITHDSGTTHEISRDADRTFRVHTYATESGGGGAMSFEFVDHDGSFEKRLAQVVSKINE